ncbi:hypothetical protein Glove_346g64 [Diversispora epigaea]|uniref:DNA-directed RNA polymerase III subunit RPC4 n=1 Tax=Diversispora epigaea TaxID=1348612 RepID=A0A397HKE5_9GLOM|nr:hypothetical protein Glove_346g64 [Diversispora epigaea]
MTEETNSSTRRGRGRPRGVRGLTRGFPSTTTATNLRGIRRGGSQGKIDLAENAGSSSNLTEIRGGGGKSNSSVRALSPDRLTLSPDRLPPPGRLASVRTAPTGHYFLPTSSRVTLRGTQRMNFVPTVPLAHRRPQPTITSDSITPDFFDNLDNDNNSFGGDSLGHDMSTRGRANTRGRGRFMPELAASGPFAYGSLSNFTPSGSMINRNDPNQPIVEERKNRSDLASDFESFRDDPWAPDMIYTYDEKEDRTLENVDNDNYVGQDDPLHNDWRGKRDQPINFDEIDERQLLCFQLPISLPKFESPKHMSSSQSTTKEVSTENKPKGKITEKIKPTVAALKGKEKEMDVDEDTDKINKLEGQIGRLVIRRSGKVQMLMGELVFDVSRGLDRSFLENAMVVDPDVTNVYNFGPIESHLVVKPDISSVLGG